MSWAVLVGFWILLPIVFFGTPIVVGVVLYRSHRKKLNKNRIAADTDPDLIEASEELNKEFRAGQISLEKELSLRDEIEGIKWTKRLK